MHHPKWLSLGYFTEAAPDSVAIVSIMCTMWDRTHITEKKNSVSTSTVCILSPVNFVFLNKHTVKH